MAIHKLETRSDWLSLGTRIEIDELSRYLDAIKEQLENMAKVHEKRVDDEAAKIKDEEERDRFYEWAGEDHWRYTKTMPQIFLNSFFVSTYSLLESEIYKVSRRIGTKHKQLFDVSEVRRGDYLESACYYIERITGIKAKDFDSWSSLKEGQKLRNIIVHSNGKVIEDKDIELAKRHNVFIEEKIEITGRPIGEISVTYEFCKSFLDALRSFFTELYKQTKAGNFV